jgi:ABC-2 type transport system permease protein
LIFLALAPAAGIWLSAGAIGAAAAIMIVTAFALTSIGLIIAWRIESTRGFHLIMNSILVPIWFLSGAFFPAGGAPAWLGWIMRINPLTYQMAALRRALYLGHPSITGPIPVFSLTIPVSIVFAIAMFTLAAVVARRSTVA